MLKRVVTQQAGVFSHLLHQWELRRDEQGSPPTCRIDENYDATSRGDPILVALKRIAMWWAGVSPHLLHQREFDVTWWAEVSPYLSRQKGLSCLRVWCSVVEKHISIVYCNIIKFNYKPILGAELDGPPPTLVTFPPGTLPRLLLCHCCHVVAAQSGGGDVVGGWWWWLVII